MHGEMGYRPLTMAVSFLFVAVAYLLICRKDKSWINWYTPSAVFTVGADYILQLAYLLFYEPSGSEYAYLYCYATYALAAIGSALAYCYLKPVVLFRDGERRPIDIGLLPWSLLMVGIFLYLPVLVEFRGLLFHPREIYSATRTGYGLSFFGSAMFANLAFVMFLFRTPKRFLESLAFSTAWFLLIYLHGSKGQLLTPFSAWILYFVYVRQRRIKLRHASIILFLIASFVTASFFIFGSFSSARELLTFMTEYSSYTRNAMVVMDDPEGNSYFGRLAVEDQVYSRIPRALLPSKPKDFGEFKLAKHYFPEQYGADAGSPAFGIGVAYADFGPFAIAEIALFAALGGWIAASLAEALRRRPAAPVFLIFLFFSGVVLIPSGDGYFLPETLVLAAAVYGAMRVSLTPKGIFKPLSLGSAD